MPPEVDFAEALVALTAQIQDLKTKLEVQAFSIADLHIRLTLKALASSYEAEAEKAEDSTTEGETLDIAIVANGDQMETHDKFWFNDHKPITTHLEFSEMVPIEAISEDPVAHVGGLSQATVALPLPVFFGFRPGGIASSKEHTINNCAIQLFDKIPKPVIIFNNPSVSKMQDQCLPPKCENVQARFIWPQQVTTTEHPDHVDFIGVSLYLEPFAANTIHRFILTRQSVVAIKNDVILLVVIVVDDVNSLSKIKVNVGIMREKNSRVFIGFRPGIMREFNDMHELWRVDDRLSICLRRHFLLEFILMPSNVMVLLMIVLFLSAGPHGCYGSYSTFGNCWFIIGNLSKLSKGAR
ncbi:hypothetical protein COLO4_36960 [Corchorus olitorius]|uniref:Uncharacterized protein n=1 Tax=Corchorus olitorius TaxID=93759 RepID=A0A1R3G3Y4_9ROSI|nr:hypothetical protein COLO4_36960 [Corchorus olitorius]